MRLVPLLLLAAACVPASAVLIEPGEDGFDTDSGAPGPDPDSGTDPDPDSGTDPDPGTDADTEPDTEAGPLRWSGVRAFVFSTWAGECEDVLVETGVAVDDEPELAAAVAACVGCDHVFYVEMDKSRLCASPGFDGFPVAQEVLRGVQFVGTDEVVVWAIGQDNRGQWGRYELAEGDRDGREITYEYDGEIWSQPFEVEGEAILSR
jgi:hypothetical protein